MRGIRKEYLWAVALSQDTWHLFPSMQCSHFALTFFFLYRMINFKAVLLFSAVLKCCSTLQLCVKERESETFNLYVFESQYLLFGGRNVAATINRVYSNMLLHCFNTEKLCKLNKGTKTPQNFVLNAICMQKFSQ